eukprot:CAMPEP_0183374376 /NCGR_PEP_ID=MMETSP0164_2-20130417/114315_1 /TAXON_ID=221442 /ORGANISM="Coccolithus pelagicus ssp braarudi, Strain PLY182g" /LENGTH=44 /DNA_ID= /DNA_START= /DNA_END= /DNA_ORIENTATION=
MGVALCKIACSALSEDCCSCCTAASSASKREPSCSTRAAPAAAT